MSAEGKHTPGPFKYVSPFQVWTEHSTESVAPFMVADLGHSPTSALEQQANGYLFAAAPELLAALDDALFPLTEFMHDLKQDGADSCYAQVEATFNKARAAIAKARA